MLFMFNCNVVSLVIVFAYVELVLVWGTSGTIFSWYQYRMGVFLSWRILYAI